MPNVLNPAVIAHQIDLICSPQLMRPEAPLTAQIGG